MGNLPEIVLGPLMGRPEAAWYAAPPGRWCAAQIVEHLALGLEWSAQKFAERRERPPMTRRPRTPFERMAYFCIMRLGWMPPVFEAPAAARPSERPDHRAAERRFREGVAHFGELGRGLLPARRHDLFVKHPRLGDLTLEEWMRFHAWHCRHHARQIRRRVGA